MNYIRPHLGKEGVEYAFASLPHNKTMHDFDVLVVNTYVSSLPLAAHLEANNFTGRVLVLPWYIPGVQNNTVYTNETISLHPTVKSRNLRTKETSECLPTFCNAFFPGAQTHDDEGRAGRHTTESENHHRTRSLLNSSTSTGTRSKRSPGHDPRCITLDWSWYDLQRNHDAKAALYSMQYRDDDGSLVVCASDFEDDHANHRCAGRKAQTCSETPCQYDTHYCLPGPPDEYGRLALAAALGQDDHDHEVTLPHSASNGEIHNAPSNVSELR